MSKNRKNKYYKRFIGGSLDGKWGDVDGHNDHRNRTYRWLNTGIDLEIYESVVLFSGEIVWVFVDSLCYA